MAMNCRIRKCPNRAVRYMLAYEPLPPVSWKEVHVVSDKKAHAYCQHHHDYIRRRFT